MVVDERLAGLAAWLAAEAGLEDAVITPASGDASFRRYFRVRRGDESWIAVDAPPDRETSEPFVRIARWLRRWGINAPEILAADPPRGYLLVGDLGERHYLDVLDADSADRLYGDALSALLTLQRQGRTAMAALPPYDEPLLRLEMALFTDWYLGRHLGLDAARAAASLAPVFDHLVANALHQPVVFVHRDYHSRNLLEVTGASPGVLDFQDAVRGPVTYDLVSLLRDCYIAWPAGRVAAWALAFREQAVARGLDAGPDEATFLRWFDLMGVQRHLKASGIFARLCHRDGKRGYLADIPRTLGYVREVSARYPELAPLHELTATLPSAEVG